MRLSTLHRTGWRDGLPRRARSSPARLSELQHAAALVSRARERPVTCRTPRTRKRSKWTARLLIAVGGLVQTLPSPPHRGSACSAVRVLLSVQNHRLICDVSRETVACGSRTALCAGLSAAWLRPASLTGRPSCVLGREGHAPPRRCGSAYQVRSPYREEHRSNAWGLVPVMEIHVSGDAAGMSEMELAAARQPRFALQSGVEGACRVFKASTASRQRSSEAVARQGSSKGPSGSGRGFDALGTSGRRSGQAPWVSRTEGERCRRRVRGQPGRAGASFGWRRRSHGHDRLRRQRASAVTST